MKEVTIRMRELDTSYIFQSPWHVTSLPRLFWRRRIYFLCGRTDSCVRRSTTKTVASHSGTTDSIVVDMSQDARNFAGIHDWVYTSTRIKRETAGTLITAGRGRSRVYYHTLYQHQALRLNSSSLILCELCHDGGQPRRPANAKNQYILEACR